MSAAPEAIVGRGIEGFSLRYNQWFWLEYICIRSLAIKDKDPHLILKTDFHILYTYDISQDLESMFGLW